MVFTQSDQHIEHVFDFQGIMHGVFGVWSHGLRPRRLDQQREDRTQSPSALIAARNGCVGWVDLVFLGGHRLRVIESNTPLP